MLIADFVMGKYTDLFSTMQLKIVFSVFGVIVAALLIFQQNAHGTDYTLHHNPQSYVLNKFQTHDIVFLGTRHKQPPIFEFISDLIPKLHDSGVTIIGLEIASDQQSKIDRFPKTGNGLSDIEIHLHIDCPEYRNLFNVIRDLGPDKRPTPVALDLPKSKYSGKIGRDEWMAESIASCFDSNSNAKVLFVVGNNHILNKSKWQDHVIDKHG